MNLYGLNTLFSIRRSFQPNIMLFTQLLSSSELRKVSKLDISTVDDLYSLELGTTNNHTTCPTCNKKDCSGHIGLIKLPIIIVHPLFENVVKNMINSHCHQCGKYRSKIMCVSCNTRGSIYKYKEKSYNTMVSGTGELSCDDIARILHMISPGYENMLIQYIVVPPNRFRISLPEYPDSTELSKAYITLIRSLHLKDTIKLYGHLKNILGSQSTSILYRMISGKRGVFRETGLGKRVNRSGRATICCDPFIRIDEVGIPRIIADDFMKRVYITFNNFHTFRDLYDRNKNPIRTIIPGMEAYRKCIDGDMVCLNRQPSLSKYSILSFKAKIHDEGNVIFINPCITTSFNADFDGDEMNLFLLDGDNQYEMENVLYVGNNTKYIRPIQDTIVGLYLMTQREEYPKFPENVQYNSRGISIDNGVMTTGILNKTAIYEIIQQCDINFIYELQLFVAEWLMTYGFTVNSQDCRGKYNEYSDSIALYKTKVFDDEEDAKTQIDGLRKVIESKLDCDNNNLYDIIQSGSKGNMLNFIQITTYVGQQYVNGNRIEGSGFCSNNFFDGLDAKEFFYHQMAAREGIVNTGVSTSETGYLNRRVAKVTSDIVYDEYGNVINNDDIIQYRANNEYNNVI